MDAPRRLETLYKEAVALKSRGQTELAAALENQAAQLLAGLEEQARHPDDPGYADALLYLAERDWALLGDDERIAARLGQARAWREERFGAGHPLVGEVAARQAEFHYLAGRLGQAQVLYEGAIPLLENSPASDGLVYSRALEGMAHTLAALGRPAEADVYFARAIDRAAADDQGRRVLYFLLMSRADGLERLGRAPEAGPLRQRAAALLPAANPGAEGFHV